MLSLATDQYLPQMERAAVVGFAIGLLLICAYWTYGYFRGRSTASLITSSVSDTTSGRVGLKRSSEPTSATRLNVGISSVDPFNPGLGDSQLPSPPTRDTPWLHRTPSRTEVSTALRAAFPQSGSSRSLRSRTPCRRTSPSPRPAPLASAARGACIASARSRSAPASD